MYTAWPTATTGRFATKAQYMAGVGKKPVAIKPTDGDIVWRST